MQAAPVKNAILVQDVQTWNNGYTTITCLVVSLGSGERAMWTAYSKLPNVIEFNGQLFGKSSWNSDNGRAYYRNDVTIATAK